MKQSIVVSVLAVAVLAAGVFLLSSPPVSAQGGGSISGEVKFAGAAPAPKVVKVNKDNEVCGQEKKVADVVVGAGGGLSEALVSVPGAKGAKPAKPAVLDQKGCKFQPHVVVMAPGELEILNSDGMLHNIHTFSTANPPINKAQPKFKKDDDGEAREARAHQGPVRRPQLDARLDLRDREPHGRDGRQRRVQARERAARQAQGRGRGTRCSASRRRKSRSRPGRTPRSRSS